MNYAGFERQSWKGRSRLAHKQEALCTLEARSPAERAKLESKHGCRYSSLLQLPYFDPSRMLVIDPMHNLFLGSAKHFLKSVLLPKVSNNQFDIIQARIDFLNFHQTWEGYQIKYILALHHLQQSSGKIGQFIFL